MFCGPSDAQIMQRPSHRYPTAVPAHHLVVGINGLSQFSSGFSIDAFPFEKSTINLFPLYLLA